MATPDDGAWDDAVKETIEILTRVAREQDTISYKRFVGKLKSISIPYHGDRRLQLLLDEASRAEDAAGRGLISALVVQGTFPEIPSDGFYFLAEPRHPSGTSKIAMFEAERDRVWEAHSSL